MDINFSFIRQWGQMLHFNECKTVLDVQIFSQGIIDLWIGAYGAISKMLDLHGLFYAELFTVTSQDTKLTEKVQHFLMES